MFFEKAVLKIFRKFSKNHLRQGILKAYNYAECELCCWCFTRNFLKIFRTTILKEKLSMDVLCFIKNTSGWVLLMRQHSKKALLEVNPPQGLPWKQNCTTVLAAVMILKVVSNWKSMLQINILKKKLDLEP